MTKINFDNLKINDIIFDKKENIISIVIKKDMTIIHKLPYIICLHITEYDLPFEKTHYKHNFNLSFKNDVLIKIK